MKVISLALAVVAAFALHGSLGCSEFLYNASHWDAVTDGPVPVMTGRTMDFASDQQSVLEIVPRGTTIQELPAHACAECAIYRWNNSLGFVAVNIESMNLAMDGLNEKGLSAAWLAIPEMTSPRIDSSSSGDSSRDASLPVVTSICTYMLGNFASVNEVREGLNRVYFAGFDNRLLDLLPSPGELSLTRGPLYVSVRDATGDSLVIEFLDGKTTIYDDLEHALATKTASPVHKADGISTDGHAFREYHPVYRVQRISAMNHDVHNKGSTQSVVFRMLRMLNAVRLPTADEATGRSLVRDHLNLQLFVQSAQNPQLRRVDLAQIDFESESSRRSVPLAHGDWFIDISNASRDEASSASRLTGTTEMMAQERSPAPVRPHDRLSWFSFVSGLSWGAILTLGAIYGAPWIAMQIRRRKYKQIHDVAYL